MSIGVKFFVSSKRLQNCNNISAIMMLAVASLLALGRPEAASAGTKTTFRHPGAMHTTASIERIKAKIVRGQEPWASHIKKVEQKALPAGAAFVTIDGGNKIQADASEAEAVKVYANALAWRLTGNRGYSRQASAILKAWAGFQGFVGGNDQEKLHAGWIGVLFGGAAEIMRSSPDWSAGDIAASQRMFRRAFYPQLSIPSRWNGNVDLTQIEALLTIAIFNDDEAEFRRGLQRLETRSRAYIFLQSDLAPAAIAGDDGNSVAFWFNPAKWVDGLTQETCRDNGHHAQFGLASALHAAEIAWNQGVDVYTPQKERYTAALELLAQQLLTGNMQGVCNNAEATANIFDTFEVGFNHYSQRMGLTLPFTKKLIAQRVRPDGISALNIFHETLTHAHAPIASPRRNR
jgi:hypothetical protein